jgi:hypothetical protein
VSKGVLDTDTTAQLLASMWGPPRKSFFSPEEKSGTGAAPFAMSPQILDILQTVAKEHGKK